MVMNVTSWMVISVIKSSSLCSLWITYKHRRVYFCGNGKAFHAEMKDKKEYIRSSRYSKKYSNVLHKNYYRDKLMVCWMRKGKVRKGGGLLTNFLSAMFSVAVSYWSESFHAPVSWWDSAGKSVSCYFHKKDSKYLRLKY